MTHHRGTIQQIIENLQLAADERLIEPLWRMQVLVDRASRAQTDDEMDRFDDGLLKALRELRHLRDRLSAGPAGTAGTAGEAATVAGGALIADTAESADEQRDGAGGQAEREASGEQQQHRPFARRRRSSA
jgi:hypothetical protein